MKGIFWFLFLATACSHTPSATGPDALNGTWTLKGVRCATGKFGPLGLGIAATIAANRQEEIYEVSGQSVLWHVRERRPHGEKGTYCETTFTAKWEADGSIIRSSRTEFKSREGVHGYQCDEPFRHDQLPPSHENTYDLAGNTLHIYHHDPVMTAKGQKYHGCSDGSDLVYELVRE
jgi:hypothetical protein